MNIQKQAVILYPKKTNQNKMSNQNNNLRPSVGYIVFKSYVRFMHNKLFYRRVYAVNKEAVPAVGNPVIIVSNHQNCANDPLGMLLSLELDSRPYVIARGDVFGWSPAITKFLKWIGLLPAYRLNFEGEASLAKNEETLRLSGTELLKGSRLIMYPEGTHQDKRWLGNFSFGYTRMAFETAAMDNFATDIQILPSCNHYSSYFGIQEDFLVRFGTPISLQPYYELYKTKPRTAQREVNKLVREQIESMMLNVTDLEHYEAFDFIRNTYGVQYASSVGKDATLLPEKLESDKQLFAQMEQYKATDESAVNQLYADALAYKATLSEAKLADSSFEQKPSIAGLVLASLAQLVLLPLWIVCLWPNALCYNLPKAFLKTDVMFTNTLILILNVLVLIPLLVGGTALAIGIGTGCWWGALAWVLCYPLTMLFAWYNHKWMKRTIAGWRFVTKARKVRERLSAMRTQLFKSLDAVLGIKR